MGFRLSNVGKVSGSFGDMVGDAVRSLQSQTVQAEVDARRLRETEVASTTRRHEIADAVSHLLAEAATFLASSHVRALPVVAVACSDGFMFSGNQQPQRLDLEAFPLEPFRRFSTHYDPDLGLGASSESERGRPLLGNWEFNRIRRVNALGIMGPSLLGGSRLGFYAVWAGQTIGVTPVSEWGTKGTITWPHKALGTRPGEPFLVFWHHPQDALAAIDPASLVADEAPTPVIPWRLDSYWDGSRSDSVVYMSETAGIAAMSNLPARIVTPLEAGLVEAVADTITGRVS